MAQARSYVGEPIKHVPEDKRKPGRFGKMMFDIPERPVASYMLLLDVHPEAGSTDMAQVSPKSRETGENVTRCKRKPGRFGKLMIEMPQTPVTSMPEFARALRADVFPESYLGEFPAHWSRKRSDSWDTIDSILELYSSRDQPGDSITEDPTLELVLPELVSSVPEDCEQVMASADVLRQILSHEIPEWKGFWWKGTMEWI